MTEPKSAKTFTAIVDFKSGRKGFYEEHELQLHLYREMWNVNFEDKPIERVFNFSPKDWRTKPTYNLKDQTDSVNAKKLPYLLALATIEDEKRDNTLTIIRGVLDLDNGKIADNMLTLSLSELIRTKADSKEAPKQAAAAPEPAKEQKPAKKPRKKAVKAQKEPAQVNTPSEPEKPVKTEINEKLPWENETEPGTKEFTHWAGENSHEFNPPLKVGPDFMEKPAGPTPEQIAEQAAKDNLLNAEMEL